MDEIVSVAQTFIDTYGNLMAKGVCDSIVMTGVSVLLAYLVGVPLGVILVITAKNGLHPKPVLNAVLGWVVNVLRSIPFIILLVCIIPFTRLVAGTSLGVPGAIVPLTVCAIPFVARMVEQSLEEVDGGVIEAARCMGATNWQIITRVLLVESVPSLLRGLTISTITVFGYTAITGATGAGGLGNIAFRFGYQRYQQSVMYASLALVILVVCLIQTVFGHLASKADKRNR